VRREVEIAVLDAATAMAAIDELADVLVDCVEGGAGVSFMQPFSHEQAVAFFRGVIGAVARGGIVLIAAKDDGRIVGTVQLGVDLPPSQPHRADVKKLLVHRSARRRGVGPALMAKLEEEARIRGRGLLVLDSATGPAERLYTRLGWTRAGVIPNYALWPDGSLCDTIYFWKRV
jgi:ribosomal protein S18 acetylase RimI-like enzyme